MIAVFGDWFISVTTNSVDDIDYAGRSPAGSVYAYWSAGGLTFSADYPGQYDAAVPWRTGLAIDVVDAVGGDRDEPVTEHGDHGVGHGGEVADV
jgi:hypothetical protein